MDIITLLLLINLIRVNPLQIDQDLTQRAEQRATYLCDNNQFSHDNMKTFFKGRGGYVGENLARGYNNEVSMFIALYNSETHRQNMQKEQYKNIGIATECDTTVFLFN